MCQLDDDLHMLYMILYSAGRLRSMREKYGASRCGREDHQEKKRASDFAKHSRQRRCIAKVSKGDQMVLRRFRHFVDNAD